MSCFQTLLADSRNPATGQAYGEGFMQNGVLNVWGECDVHARNLFSNEEYGFIYLVADSLHYITLHYITFHFSQRRLHLK